MNSDDSEDEILPEARIFDNRVDDIWNTKMEAYEELFHKNKLKDEEEALESEKKDLLSNIAETQKNRKNNSKNSNKKRKKGFVSPVSTSPSKSTRSSQRIKNLDVVADQSDDLKDDSLPDSIQLPASAKKRLKKLQMETERQRKRVDAETRRLLSSENKKGKKSKDTEIIDCDLVEQDIDLKFRYLSRISKITVGWGEVFKSIFKKVADEFKLEPTEILLCLGDKTIQLDDTPESINVRSFEIIDCFPYKSETASEKDTNKLLLKIQSNDTRKKTEIYTHKLEKLEEVMKKYAESRKIPLNDLVFEFDGEKIEGSETPADLDMESGSCIDVIVLSFKLPPSKSPPVENFEQIPKSEMLNICVLD